MARTRREPTPHTKWCARDHRCGLAEHRGPGVIADHLGARAVIVRVRAGDIEYAEVTARIPLSSVDAIAQRRLGITLHLIRRLLAAVAAVRPETLPARTDRPALDRRPAA
ncbi:hypothetical protein Abr02nite_18040 [Paractinoplanes brasiliensis]|nr:hypothetical protein Abr02nite_18040 [Actinoplanes brasiliensis]